MGGLFKSIKGLIFIGTIIAAIMVYSLISIIPGIGTMFTTIIVQAGICVILGYVVFIIVNTIMRTDFGKGNFLTSVMFAFMVGIPFRFFMWFLGIF